MNRRKFFGLLGAAALGAACSSPRCGKNRDLEKPNILFIAIDDLRPQIGCYGRNETISPHIDGLAARGALFERAYCSVPVCGPSRVSVLTGIRTAANQWKCSDLKRDFTTLPAHFRRHGYHTLSNGKVFHHLHDQCNDWSEPPWRSAEIYHGEKDWAGYNTYGVWQEKNSARAVNPKTGRGPYCEAADVPDNAYQDGKVADRTIADLERLKETDKPFFLAAGFWRPHLPFNAPKKYWDLYRREDVAMAANRSPPENLPGPCRSSKEIDRYSLGSDKSLGNDQKTSDAFHREARHAYYACVSYVDAQVGRVLSALDALGLSENTIVVLWGDHGWNLGEHGFWGKHNTLDNSLRAPLIVAAPDHRPGVRTAGLVEFVDIFPSLCELAGIEAPGHLEGTSFVPLMKNPDRKWKPAVFCRWSGCEAVKTDRYLYTEWKKKGRVTDRMLYDHETDPLENRNIAEEPEAREIVDPLSGLLNSGWKNALPGESRREQRPSQPMRK